MPSLSVVIPTRDRGDTVVAAVRSLLAAEPAGFEIIVVDQSEGDGTRDALRPFADRLRYQRSFTVGVSHARNEGVDCARAELVGLIDDDCTVAPDWPAQLTAALHGSPRIGAVFGNVLPVDHDPRLGFVPSYVRESPFLALGVGDKNRVEGLSACMGTRRALWRELGGFDPMLGAGAPLRSGAESDYALRVLLAGHQVLETPALAVLHDGFRDWRDGQVLLGRYWYGTGAMFAKHVRRHPRTVTGLLSGLAVRWVSGRRSGVARALGARPYRWHRLAAFVRGFARGLRTPLEPRHGHFAERDATGSTHRARQLS